VLGPGQYVLPFGVNKFTARRASLTRSNLAACNRVVCQLVEKDCCTGSARLETARAKRTPCSLLNMTARHAVRAGWVMSIEE
jgi:hypothetical protein